MTMRYGATFLTDNERDRVHEASLRILAEAGVRFHGERALPLLAGAGAEVDLDAGVARIPRALVEAALASAPSAFVLGARNPAHDYALPSPVTRYAIDGTAAFAIDFETGERRYGTRRDTELGLRVFQAADLGVMAWAPVTASDAPAGTRALHEFVGMLRALLEARPARAPHARAGPLPRRGADDRRRQRQRRSASATPGRSSTARSRRSSTTGRCSTPTSTSASSTSR